MDHLKCDLKKDNAIPVKRLISHRGVGNFMACKTSGYLPWGRKQKAHLGMPALFELCRWRLLSLLLAAVQGWCV